MAGCLLPAFVQPETSVIMLDQDIQGKEDWVNNMHKSCTRPWHILARSLNSSWIISSDVSLPDSVMASVLRDCTAGSCMNTLLAKGHTRPRAPHKIAGLALCL